SEQVTVNMDWLPTLLAAAGVEADPGYPPDGMNLLPHLAQGAPIVERRLFWRYKSLGQRATRVGGGKYFHISGNTCLFKWVGDPLERPNHRDRHRNIYDRLVDEWHRWNTTMLPETAASFTENFTGAEMADHIGLKTVTRDPDPDLRCPV